MIDDLYVAVQQSHNCTNHVVKIIHVNDRNAVIFYDPVQFKGVTDQPWKIHHQPSRPIGVFGRGADIDKAISKHLPVLRTHDGIDLDADLWLVAIRIEGGGLNLGESHGRQGCRPPREEEYARLHALMTYWGRIWLMGTWGKNHCRVCTATAAYGPVIRADLKKSAHPSGRGQAPIRSMAAILMWRYIVKLLVLTRSP